MIAEYKNLPLTGTLLIKVWLSQLFVRLHLPLPVIIIFLPTLGFFSISVTPAPSCAAVPAAIKPAAPAPTTITFLLVIGFLLVFVVTCVNVLAVPNLLELAEGFGNLVLFLKNRSDNQRVDKAERRYERIDD